MAITKTKRTEETRESTSKIETSSFEEENYLDIPQAVKGLENILKSISSFFFNKFSSKYCN